MAIIFWGTHVFPMNRGYHGSRVRCSHCNRVYSPAYVSNSYWFHIWFIPLIPYKTTYFKYCPICGYGISLNGKEGRAELKDNPKVTDQRLEPYVNHIYANKPKGVFKIDNSYEFHIKDLNTGEDICISRSITKGDVDKIKRGRAYNKLPIIKIK